MRTLAGFFVMHYNKPPLTIEQQVCLLQSRGLAVPDQQEAISCLYFTNYYRLSAYCIPFQSEKDKFNAGITLQHILDLYRFDSDLRHLVFRALETIEIAIRAQTAYFMAHNHGAQGYTDPKIFSPYFYGHARWMQKLREKVERSKEEFVQHFKSKYSLSSHLPIWMAMELVSFGALSRLVAGLTRPDRTALSKQYRIPEMIFRSWLHALSVIRNICAHHGRLWNRELSIKPVIPYSWNEPFKIQNTRIFSILSIIYHLLKQMDSDHLLFKNQIVELLRSRSDKDAEKMGFQTNWLSHKIWS